MNTKIPIIFEDNHLLVIEKPPNILSQEDRTGDIDMLTLLKKDIKIRYNKPGNVYLGLVHRLDRPVGGIMVLLKPQSLHLDYLTKYEGENLKNGIWQLCMVTLKDKDTLEHYLLKNKRTNMVCSKRKY